MYFYADGGSNYFMTLSFLPEKLMEHYPRANLLITPWFCPYCNMSSSCVVVASSYFAAAHNLVQISNPFGEKTLQPSHAIHSHCIHLFHRCSCFFPSRIYLKWWEESSFACFCRSVQCPMGPQCSPGAWAHQGRGWQRSGSARALQLQQPEGPVLPALYITALRQHEVFKLGWFSAPW